MGHIVMPAQMYRKMEVPFVDPNSTSSEMLKNMFLTGYEKTSKWLVCLQILDRVEDESDGDQ